MKNTRICARDGCGTRTRRKEKKYCSAECYKLDLYGGVVYPLKKICPECSNQFSVAFPERGQKFCSRSCSTTSNNRNIQRNFRSKRCAGCDALIVSNMTYCSLSCRSSHKVSRWLSGEDFGPVHPHGSVIRNYLYVEQDHRCAVCSLPNTWNGQDLRFILDHTDGNSSNNTRENLRLVCGNCDLQLPTSRGKNRGSGRHYRRERYSKGKSF